MIEGERKQVTILFADVTGSQEMAESVDPEDWHRILDRFFKILADGVHRFEGISLTGKHVPEPSTALLLGLGLLGLAIRKRKSTHT